MIRMFSNQIHRSRKRVRYNEEAYEQTYYTKNEGMSSPYQTEDRHSRGSKRQEDDNIGNDYEKVMFSTSDDHTSQSDFLRQPSHPNN